MYAEDFVSTDKVKELEKLSGLLVEIGGRALMA
jgi:hypothetical protein